MKCFKMIKLCRCWTGGVQRKRGQTIPCPVNDPAVLIQAINQAASHFSGQLKLNEQVEKARAFHTVKLLQDSILYPEEEDVTAGLKDRRPASPLDYTLDIDFTAAKVVDAVIDKCKLFLCVSAQYREGCQELLTTLQGLHDILVVIQSANDILLCNVPRKERLSFGVTTYLVPIYNVARRLYKKKQVVLPLTEVDGKSGYKVEVIYPRKRWSHDVGLMTKVESNDRGYNQILQADHVKIEKGGWGWEAAQDTVLITFEDLLVANVASIAGSLLRFNKHMAYNDEADCVTQTYRTSIQVVGSSRIDLDLQNLFIKGTKDKDNIYLKCFVTTEGEEILAIYRYHRRHFHKAEGLLHIVGRGNQPGLRHVLVSIFSSLGFTSAV